MATAPTVLVVDADPAAAATLGPALRRDGYKVRTARDGGRALQLAVLRTPDLILLSDDTPVVAPATVVRILRANPRTRAIPLVTMTHGGGSVDGTDGIVRKPVDMDEVRAVLRRLLAPSPGGAAARRVDEDRVEGSLAQLPLADVLQMLGNNRRTGRLLLTSESGAHVEIAFSRGEIFDAAWNGCGGCKALFRALALRSGQFSFQAGPVEGPRTIEKRIDELLLEGFRDCDELALLQPQLPAEDEVLVLDGGAAVESADPALAEVREALAEPRTLREVLDRTTATDLRTLGAVVTLLAAGALRSIPPGRPPAPFLAAPVAEALRSRLRRDGSGVRAGKVLVSGGDEDARRAALRGFSGFQEFRAAAGADVAFGTVGTFQLGDVRLDVVLLPSDPVLLPLRSALAAGALAELQLDGGAASSSAPAYLGDDPGEALRAVVERAVARRS